MKPDKPAPVVAVQNLGQMIDYCLNTLKWPPDYIKEIVTAAIEMIEPPPKDAA